MEQSFDLTADALYLTLRDGNVARTRELDEGTNVDLDADGNVLGIEVLSPGRAWPLARILKEFDLSERDATDLILAYGLPRTIGVA